jgi:ABC-type Na+ efflux pump permease subunit
LEKLKIQSTFRILFSGPASLELKLKAMQKQLLEMTDIPPQIQAKVAMITKALEQFMTMDAEAFEESIERDSKRNSSEENDDDDQVEQEQEDETEEEIEEKPLKMQRDDRNEKQFYSIPEEDEDEIEEDEYENETNNINELYSTRETSYSLDDDNINSQRKNDNDEILSTFDIKREEELQENVEELESDEEVIEKTEEEIRLEEEKRKKQEKLQKLEQHWQKLCTNTKTIHK